MPKDEQTMFDQVCKDHFDRLEVGQKSMAEKVDKLSDRLFKNNGQRAVVTVIEDNTKAHERLVKKVDEHIEASKPAAQRTVKKMQLTREGITIQGVSGPDMIKMLLLLVIILYMVGSDHLPGFLVKMFPDETPVEAVSE